MGLRAWLNAGKIVIDAARRILLCESCPCVGTGTGPEPCGGCPVLPSAWTVTLAGFSNSAGCSSCATYNTTWTLDFVSGATTLNSYECIYEANGNPCDVDPAIQLVYRNDLFGDTARWLLFIFANGAGPNYVYGIDPASFDCLGPNTLDRDLNADGFGCTGSPATVTINPV